MKQSDSIAKIAAALVAAQHEIKPVAKDATNPHFKNRYASLDAIIETTRPALAKHGLAVVQGATAPITDESGHLVGFAVETMLVHQSGEWMQNAAIMPLAKGDAQGAGGALTYGRRYGLSALLALATEEDDDGNAASRRAATEKGLDMEPVRTTRSQDALARVPKPAANGDRGSHAKKMPFGKNKGTALGELDTRDLASTVDWCSSDAEKKEKFKDLIAACNDVLADRAASESDTEVEIPF